MHGIRVEHLGRSTIVTAGGDQHRLVGTFTFDALSPDEQRLYLVEHRPPDGSENYRVRLLELDTGRLQPEPIADKSNLRTDMSGLPMARTTTSDGVWVFTLYRGEEHAFVHALNTRDAYASCLDLDHGCCGADGKWRLELDESETQLTAIAGAPGDAFTFDLAQRLGPGSL